MIENYCNEKTKFADMMVRFNHCGVLSDEFMKKYAKTVVEKGLGANDVCFITHNFVYLADWAMNEAGALKAVRTNKPTYSDAFAHWAGYLYRHWTLFRKTPLSEILVIAPLSELDVCWIYHTMDLNLAIDRLIEGWGKPKQVECPSNLFPAVDAHEWCYKGINTAGSVSVGNRLSRMQL